MADFCNYCAEHMWGDPDDDAQMFPPDIDVYEEFNKLKEDTFVSGFICEGCGLIAIANIKGELKVAHIQNSEQETVQWEDYTDKFNIQ